ncbi:lytic murein transglycosylase [Aquicoccus porphyridii]|uniref:Lytic murein transglycosylase n=1 Tax=Aquicoccus porphyridii TaxID=1852029 RepID=A0A5A9YYY0_9RHOB|nr:lytic murein transglycosylase [Aquicoccus porphyridii]KAA0910058.1 lytic murein transglycosylase [Aquicoccus porphyridii]RAI53493.1 lytic murein transglycosylase [Rhodobacteraceae bacterium AsT-22]
MTVTRRFFTIGAAAGLVAGCRAGPGQVIASTTPVDPGLQPQPNAGYDAWVASFRGRAEAAGISRATLDAAFRGAGFLPGVVERDRNQTEFTRTTEDYLAIVASEDKVARGRAAFAQRRALLGEIETRFGVPAQIVAAIWGVESQYGTRRGNIPVISATSTLAYDGRRGSFFESQLMAALRILERGDTTPARMTGSWAGAMGHTQFIPTTYQSFAVDFQGDGKRDIWSEDPTDGLASAAAYLAKSGWRRGRKWGLEVVVSQGFNPALAGRGKGRAVSEWAAMGVRPAAGGSLPDHGAASVLLPAGPGGPAFMIFSNFNVLLRYNNSENYGLGVGYLSDRLAGGGPLRGRFPPDDDGLTIDDRKEIQRRLTARGYDTGGVDGVLGKKSEAAIREWQAAQGVAVTGRPSRGLLAQLGG